MIYVEENRTSDWFSAWSGDICNFFWFYLMGPIIMRYPVVEFRPVYEGM